MDFHYNSFSTFLYPLILSCFSLILLVESTENGDSEGVTLDFIHRDSPHSPSYNSFSTRFERVQNAVDRSFSRKYSLTLSSIRLSSRSNPNIQSSITPIGGEYLMKINIGTPSVEQFGVADTAGDLTWIQCKPCTSCFQQRSPLFDPTKTKSYKKISCESDQCAAFGGESACDSNNGCLYKATYGDKSSSFGELANETFTFSSTSGRNVPFPEVVFGCGHQNDGTGGPLAGSGKVGLGRGSISIINQLQSSVGGKFSYCLTFLDSNVSSKISFGRNSVVTGPNVVSTPLVKKSPGSYYYLTLQGFSVGSEKLRQKEVALRDEGNIVIDSGTALSFIPVEFYRRLKNAVVKAIKGNRARDPQGKFDLCYQLPRDGPFNPPPITAPFKGADVVLPEGSSFLEVQKGLVCLTLLPSEDLAIFGNLHQMNYHIGFDLVKQRVSFQPTDCTKYQ